MSSIQTKELRKHAFPNTQLKSLRRKRDIRGKGRVVKRLKPPLFYTNLPEQSQSVVIQQPLHSNTISTSYATAGVHPTDQYSSFYYTNIPNTTNATAISSNLTTVSSQHRKLTSTGTSKIANQQRNIYNVANDVDVNTNAGSLKKYQSTAPSINANSSVIIKTSSPKNPFLGRADSISPSSILPMSSSSNRNYIKSKKTNVQLKSRKHRVRPRASSNSPSTPTNQLLSHPDMLTPPPIRRTQSRIPPKTNYTANNATNNNYNIQSRTPSALLRPTTRQLLKGLSETDKNNTRGTFYSNNKNNSNNKGSDHLSLLFDSNSSSSYRHPSSRVVAIGASAPKPIKRKTNRFSLALSSKNITTERGSRNVTVRESEEKPVTSAEKVQQIIKSAEGPYIILEDAMVDFLKPVSLVLKPGAKRFPVPEYASEPYKRSPFSLPKNVTKLPDEVVKFRRKLIESSKDRVLDFETKETTSIVRKLRKRRRLNCDKVERSNPGGKMDKNTDKCPNDNCTTTTNISTNSSNTDTSSIPVPIQQLNPFPMRDNSFCAICKINFKNYLQHIQMLKHSENVKKMKNGKLYKDVDMLLDEMMC